MVARVWPVGAVSGSPQYVGRTLRQTTVAPFIAGATGLRPLGARSGVRPGTGIASLTSTSTTWQMAPFAGVIDGETAAQAGPYAFSFDEAVQGPVTAADSTYPRVDIVSVQVSDPDEGDTTGPSIALVYTAGTPAASPLAPGDSGSSVAAPARSFVVGRINVPKSGGGSPTVAWAAPVAVAGGGIVPVYSYLEMANIAGAYPGQYAHLVYDAPVATAGLWQYNPNGWNVYGGWAPVGAGARAIGSATAATNWTIDTTTSRVSRTANTVKGTIVSTAGSSVTPAAGQVVATLPTGFRPAVPYVTNAALVSGGSTPGAATMLINTDGTCVLQSIPNTTSKGFRFSFDFEAA